MPQQRVLAVLGAVLLGEFLRKYLAPEAGAVVGHDCDRRWCLADDLAVGVHDVHLTAIVRRSSRSSSCTASAIALRRQVTASPPRPVVDTVMPDPVSLRRRIPVFFLVMAVNPS
jgi:hypothetical protein